MFEASRVQMVSVTISPRGTNRASEFSRVDEYAFFVFVGSASVHAFAPLGRDDEEVRWQYLRRGQKTLVRGSRPESVLSNLCGHHERADRKGWIANATRREP